MTDELREILQCPNCGSASMMFGSDTVACNSCHKKYPVLDGVPDMRVYESRVYKNDFNESQALHEKEVHDFEAQGTYEDNVIRIYGAKTRILAEDWCLELENISDPVVLDYGCGTGQISGVLANYAPRLFAFDISSVSVLKNVRDNGVGGIVANSFFLPFKDNSFDLICINGVLHHIIDLERAVSEIARVARNIVCVSEGIPRPEPYLGRAFCYPGFSRKLWYALYILAYRTRRFLGSVKRKFASLFPHDSAPPSPSEAHKGSRYERALDHRTVESLFLKNGFKRKKICYFTNIDFPGNGVLKKWLTRRLVCDNVGTHFDLRLKKSYFR